MSTSTKGYKKNSLSKGERLGWEKISEQKKIPLRAVVSEGKKVCFAEQRMDNSKFIVP